MRLGRLVLPPIFLILVLGVGVMQMTRHTPAADAAGAALGSPSAICNAGSATVTFNWQPTFGLEQWLDVSRVEDNFAPGKFTGHEVNRDASSATIPGFSATTPMLWRINTFTEGGWLTSDTGAFVPCGGPVLLWGPLACEGKFYAHVEFRWAPSLTGVTVQYVDLSYDPGFGPGNFVGAGPVSPTVSKYAWYNLQANIQTYFRINALGEDGVWRTSQTGGFNADCAPPVNPNIQHTADRLVIGRLGIDAPVNLREVALDGKLGDPEGPLDVVRYDFPLFDTLGGYPGNGGTTMIAGHVDFRNYGLAVFAPLREIVTGDVVTYYRSDGSVVSYVVDWVADLDPNYPFGELAQRTEGDYLVLVTCNGTFDWDIERYSHRRVAHATRLP